eukprot:TRINITY_DN29723_c0_g1_i1.p1 TRINITY_DN29723_c0_g1~~TRINITY_DN29723_c0_g1_i1.p1  ORF type:complete len:388 (+),score=59.72 TRINITY_DN29723_c0_g1_i1:207-1370(+)
MEQSNPFEMDRVTHQRYMALFDLERWYHALEDLTAQTRIVPICRQEAEALADVYRRRWSVGQPSMGVEEQDRVLRDLMPRVDEAIGMIETECVFGRLSTRSPKDVGQNAEDHPDAVAICMTELVRVGGAMASPSDQLKAGLRTSGALMRVQNANQTVQLLGASERTYTDLVRALVDEDVEWSMAIILREWQDLDLGDEYRCVVCGGQVTAILQYNDLCFYPHVYQSIGEVAESILGWYRDCLQPRLPYSHCIVDVWHPPNGQPRLIEINPFGPGTGIPFTASWGGLRRELQGGKDVFGDLGSSSDPELDDPHEGVWYTTQKFGITMVRVAMAPPAHVTQEYVDALMPLLAPTRHQCLGHQETIAGASGESEEPPTSCKSEGGACSIS